MYLMLLAIAWAVVLLPPLVQRLLVTRPMTGRDPLAALARRQQTSDGVTAAANRPRPGAQPSAPEPYMPRSTSEAEQRRRLVAVAFGALVLVTVMLVPVLGAPALVLHVVVDAALIGFGYAWWRRNQALDATTASVVALTSLRPTAGTPRPAVVSNDLARVVNG